MKPERMTGMSRKDRVLRAIRHQPVDRVPMGELCIDDAVVGSFLGIEKPSHRHRQAFAERIGLDLVCLATQYAESSLSTRLPDPDQAGWPDLEGWARETDFFPFVLVEGAFAWGVRRWGFEGFMLKVVRDDPLIQTLNLEIEILNTRLARSSAEKGAAGVVLADDIAYQNGLLISPEMLRAAFFPAMARQVNMFKALGLEVFFHSDGNLVQILDDIVDAGFDGLQCIEEAAGMDLLHLKRLYGHRLCLWGNLDPVFLIAPRAQGVLEAKVREVLCAGSPGSGFIFGTSSGLFQGVRAELVGRAYRLAREASILSEDRPHREAQKNNAPH